MNSENQINIIGLKNIPLIEKGDNLAVIISNTLKNNENSLEDGDILVIAQTIVSKRNGRIINLNEIKPSEKAEKIFEVITPKVRDKGMPVKDSKLIQLILNESKEILKTEHVLITETNHGFVCANAGIDKSNIKGEENFALLPENPDNDAEKIRKELKTLTGKDIAIIISDSFGRPFRIGSVGVAIGVSGINPLLDKRGSKDLFGYELKTTIIGQVDSLASAAQLIMGEADEGIPIVLIKGYKFEFIENSSIKTILRKKELDLFREGEIENTIKILKNRRSYKFDFDTKKVKRKKIEECIDLARWAPSAHNGQFWRYIIMEIGPMREKLINKMNEKLRQDLEKDGKTELFINTKIKKTQIQLLKAPYLILLCLETADLGKYPDEERTLNEYIMGIQSISASGTYLLLAFELKKLAACWYCAPLYAKEICRDLLKLSESFIPMAFFTVGYPLKKVKAPYRKDLKDLLINLKIK